MGNDQWAAEAAPTMEETDWLFTEGIASGGYPRLLDVRLGCWTLLQMAQALLSHRDGLARALTPALLRELESYTYPAGRAVSPRLGLRNTLAVFGLVGEESLTRFGREILRVRTSQKVG